VSGGERRQATGRQARARAALGLKRGRSARTRRLTRTILLGAVVVFLGIAWLARELGLDRDELLGYAFTSLLLVAGAVLLALVAAALMRLVKRLFR
jgi:drug/metabolite transporter (DMT)-like permease